MVKFAPKLHQLFVALKTKEHPFMYFNKLRSCHSSRITAYFLDLLREFSFLKKIHKTVKFKYKYNQAKMLPIDRKIFNELNKYPKFRKSHHSATMSKRAFFWDTLLDNLKKTL